MKKALYLFFVFALVLCSCSPVKDDYLIYAITELSGESRLLFYDPVEGISTPILSDWEISNISLNEKNQLAFSSSHEGNGEIYILDYPFTRNPVNISQSTSSEDFLLSWSPDGHYLAFTSEHGDDKTLSIWDGNAVSNIHQYKVSISELAWSLDNQLAFTEFFTSSFPYDGDPSEIYLWDGVSITSVSQNPSGEDRQPDWSRDGQLAFLSNRDGKKYDVLVWDGVSKNDGQPVIELQRNDVQMTYYSSPTWTNTGLLTVCATGPEDEHHYVHIYGWDSQTITNISNNPKLHNCGQTWRTDGYWSFATFFSRKQLLYVRDNENKTQLSIEGYAPTWSPNGLLAFCNFSPEMPGEKLLLWNGDEVVEIAQGYRIIAVWRNGARAFCTSA